MFMGSSSREVKVYRPECDDGILKSPLITGREDEGDVREEPARSHTTTDTVLSAADDGGLVTLLASERQKSAKLGFQLSFGKRTLNFVSGFYKMCFRVTVNSTLKRKCSASAHLIITIDSIQRLMTDIIKLE